MGSSLPGLQLTVCCVTAGVCTLQPDSVHEYPDTYEQVWVRSDFGLDIRHCITPLAPTNHMYVPLRVEHVLKL
jgi:hypothetical protein